MQRFLGPLRVEVGGLAVFPEVRHGASDHVVNVPIQVVDVLEVLQFLLDGAEVVHVRGILVVLDLDGVFESVEQQVLEFRQAFDLALLVLDAFQVALDLVTALLDLPLLLVLDELFDVFDQNAALNLVVLLHVGLHLLDLILEDEPGVLLLLGAQLLHLCEFGLLVLLHLFFALQTGVGPTLLGLHLLFPQGGVSLVFDEDLEPAILNLVFEYGLSLLAALLDFLELLVFFVLQVHDSVVHLVGHSLPVLLLAHDLVQTCFPGLDCVVGDSVKRSLRCIAGIAKAPFDVVAEEVFLAHDFGGGHEALLRSRRLRDGVRSPTHSQPCAVVRRSLRIIIINCFHLRIGLTPMSALGHSSINHIPR